MKNCKYRGVVVPMVTPVTEDGMLDVPAVERIIEFSHRTMWHRS